MSKYLPVWSPHPFQLPDHLPNPEAWQKYPFEWAYAAKGRHVLVQPDETAADDRVLAVLPDARHIAYVTLEPIGAGKEGYAFLEKVVRNLSRANNGIWIDCDGRPYTPDEGPFW